MTHAEGRYRFEDLKAKGWDMSAWTPGKTADGDYKLWIESDRFAIPTKSLVLEPGLRAEVLDIHAQERRGTIRVMVLEEGTKKKPVAGA